MELLITNLARRFRRNPESDEWERVADQIDAIADQIDAIGGRLNGRERVLVEALTLALDARDEWKRAWVKRANDDSNEGDAR